MYLCSIKHLCGPAIFAVQNPILLKSSYLIWLERFAVFLFREFSVRDLQNSKISVWATTQNPRVLFLIYLLNLTFLKVSFSSKQQTPWVQLVPLPRHKSLFWLSLTAEKELCHATPEGERKKIKTSRLVLELMYNASENSIKVLIFPLCNNCNMSVSFHSIDGMFYFIKMNRSSQ